MQSMRSIALRATATPELSRRLGPAPALRCSPVQRLNARRPVVTKAQGSGTVLPIDLRGELRASWDSSLRFGPSDGQLRPHPRRLFG